MKRHKMLAMTLLLCSAVGISTPVQAAEDGRWMIRARALGVMPDESSSISPIGGHASVNNNVVPELDFTYFFTSNLAAELILATTKHNVKASRTALGDVNAGHAWLLPPTLTMQYHFTDLPKMKPYIGAGVNYTIFYKEDAGALNTVNYDDSFGVALQAGVDIPIRDNWYFNMDVKKLWLNTTASFNNGAVKANVNLDPWLLGVGIGYRF